MTSLLLQSITLVSENSLYIEFHEELMFFSNKYVIHCNISFIVKFWQINELAKYSFYLE
jgi:hypothetical protein